MRSIPGDEHSSTLEICTAAERVSGRDTIIGAQQIRGLWRIYPQTDEARQALLAEGIVLRSVRLEVCRTNPFIVQGNENYTRLWVSNVPISVADSEIENALSRIGCELRSDIKRERARNLDGGLTNWLTGRRYVFITVPPQPLEKTLKVLDLNATLYHKEQRSVDRPRHCNNCLQDGHLSRECTREVVCFACGNPGHRRGNPVCDAWTGEQAVGREPSAGENLPQSQPSLPPPPPSQESKPSSPTIIPETQFSQTSSDPQGAMGPPLPSQSQARGRSKKKDKGGQERRTRDRSISLRNAYDILVERARSQSAKRSATEMDSSENAESTVNSKKTRQDPSEETDLSTSLDMEDGWN